MKSSKFKKSLAIFMAMILCLGVLAGCTGQQDPNGPGETQNTDSTPTDPVTQEAKITDGIFLCQAGGGSSHKMVIRFKEDGTFYANDMTEQNAYQGKYELVDMEVTYIDAGADFIVNWASNGKEGAENRLRDENGNWYFDDSVPAENQDTAGQVATQAVVFYEMDGTTPFTVNDADTDGQFYNGIASNVIAYADGKLHNVYLGNLYIRTLTHDPTNTFSDADEVRSLLYSFMPEVLPAWAVTYHESHAAAPFLINDLKLDIYQNGYDDTLTSESIISGTYTKSDNTYTLDTGAVITITAGDDGEYAAEYQKDGETLALVQWKEAAAVVAELTGEATITLDDAGNTMAIGLTLSLYEDGAAILANDKSDSKFEGTYELTNGVIALTLEGITVDTSNFDAESKEVSVTIGGSLMGRDFEGAVLNGTATDNLYSSITELGQMVGTVQPEGMPELTFTLTYFSNGTGKLAGALGENVLPVADFNWVLDMSSGVPSVEFSEITNGSFNASLDGDGFHVSWAGDVNDNLKGLELTLTEDTSFLANLL